PRFGDVGKDVEGALGLTATETLNLVQPGYKKFAALFKLRAHTHDSALISAQRLDARDLSKAGGAGVGVGHQASHVRGQIGAHDAVAHAPAGHGIGLGEAIENNGALLHAGDARNREVLALEEQAAVDFIREHEDIAVADDFGHLLHVLALHDAAGGVLRGIDDDEFGAVGDKPGQIVDIHHEIALLAKLDGYGFATHVVDHRFVDGESRIGIDDLVALIDQRQHGVEHDRLS